MKKPKTVVAAEAALSAKAAEVAAAKEALKLLELEHRTAIAAVRQAQTEADASLPQCRRVTVPWGASNDKEGGRVVILRRTPSGILVVRSVGDSEGYEERFQWAAASSIYRKAEKVRYYMDTRELRDVPAEFLPTGQAA